jgi:hypothetical protein
MKSCVVCRSRVCRPFLAGVLLQPFRLRGLRERVQESSGWNCEDPGLSGGVRRQTVDRSANGPVPQIHLEIVPLSSEFKEVSENRHLD